jgi:imidazolonepropionase-like amidohydrolase
MAETKYEITLFNCNVVDVLSGTLVEDQCVVVGLDGKIARLVSNTERQTFVPNSRQALDCQGSYVLPGLIDCHVHVTAFTADLAVLEKKVLPILRLER